MWFKILLLFLCCNIFGQRPVDANPTFSIPTAHHNHGHRPYHNTINNPHTVYNGNYERRPRPINGKERYNSICNVIHGIGNCYG